MDNNYIITIGREYGSGGLDIGMKVAEMLGIKCYDKELINLAANTQGISKKVLTELEEHRGNFLKDPTANIFHSSRKNNLPAFGAFGRSMNDRVFMAESSAIRKLADEESCVIIGRCADVLLRNRENTFTIFIQAPKEDRIKRIAERTEGTLEEAEKEMKKVDKTRSSYYEYYTDSKWGDRKGYDLMIDSSLLGIEGTAKQIVEIVQKKYIQHTS